MGRESRTLPRLHRGRGVDPRGAEDPNVKKVGRACPSFAPELPGAGTGTAPGAPECARVRPAGKGRRARGATLVRIARPQPTRPPAPCPRTVPHAAQAPQRRTQAGVPMPVGGWSVTVAGGAAGLRVAFVSVVDVFMASALTRSKRRREGRTGACAVGAAMCASVASSPCHVSMSSSRRHSRSFDIDLPSSWTYRAYRALLTYNKDHHA